MDLNWSPAVIFGLSGTVISAVAFLVTIRQIQSGSQYRYFYLSTLVWLCISIASALWTCAFLYLDPFLYLLAFLILPINGFLALLESDCIAREFVDPFKLILFVVLSAIVVDIAVNTPGIFIVTQFANGEWGIGSGAGVVGNAVFLLMILMPGCVYVYNVTRMNQQVPKKLKKYSRLYLGGLSIMVFGFTGALVSIGITWVPGIQMLFFGVGAFMMAIIIARRPKLAFVLPFKALRLTALDLNSGVPLFQYTWDVTGTLSNEALYASMIQGISLLLKESLQRGDLQEIKMAEATILVHRDNRFPVACVVVATKSSRTLHDALKLFAEQFYANYSQFFANPNNLDAFASTTTLVSECFPFVPEYD